MTGQQQGKPAHALAEALRVNTRRCHRPGCFTTVRSATEQGLALLIDSHDRHCTGLGGAGHRTDKGGDA